MFMDVRELASYHELSGVMLAATVRRYEDLMSRRQGDDYPALHGDHIYVQFRAEDYLRKKARLPSQKQRLELDGQKYAVETIEVEYGLVRLKLSSYRGSYAR